MSTAAYTYNISPSPEAGYLPDPEAVGLSFSDLAASLLEQSEDCIKLLSVDGNIEFINCGGLGAMEIDSPEMVLGKPWWELWPEESQAFVKTRFFAALQGDALEFTASCPTARGNERFWSVSFKPILATGGSVVSVQVNSRQIAFPQDA
ncbi:PAS domain-containing protein [Alteriqipengyuania sp. 357]